MPGLLSQIQGPNTGGAPPATQQVGTGATGPTAAVAGEPQPNVSPQEQQLYDRFVDRAYSVIYDEKTLPQIVESLRGDGDPLEGLANTLATVVVRVQDAAEKSGQTVPPDIVFHAGTEILEDLANLAQMAGVHSYTPDEIEGAGFRAMDIYRTLSGPESEQEQARITQDFNQLVALDGQGRLDDLAPGLTARFGTPPAVPGPPGPRGVG